MSNMPASNDPIKREEFAHKQREGTQKLYQNPEFRRKQKEGAQKRSQNPKWRHNNKKAMQKTAQTKDKKFYTGSEFRRKQKEGALKQFQDPDFLHKHKEAMQKLYRNPEYQSNHTKIMQKLCQTEEWQLKNMEAAVGGFCIQNITYRDPPRYCEFWCPDLWHRIDEAQNYQSILSGKTKEDNGGRALSRHHVYWQPRACCVWDEDVGGYYAWIETGTKKHPNKIKYYIPGDPNKFVLLTMSEHKMISKDKLKWIKIFENLIETKLDGVCYLPSV